MAAPVLKFNPITPSWSCDCKGAFRVQKNTMSLSKFTYIEWVLTDLIYHGIYCLKNETYLNHIDERKLNPTTGEEWLAV